MNAAAAIAAALELGAAVGAVRTALADFPGIWRRFERLGERDGRLIVSDYAHHPDAVVGTIAAAREFYPQRRLVACFQPHQHNRTKKLFEGFVAAFDAADVVLIASIYDVVGREATEDQDVSSDGLVAAIKARDAARGVEREVIMTGNAATTLTALRERTRPGDVVLVMGAGDIYTIAPQL
jgi:UDP-N-acetylmuramate--alanine ligase